MSESWRTPQEAACTLQKAQRAGSKAPGRCCSEHKYEGVKFLECESSDLKVVSYAEDGLLGMEPALSRSWQQMQEGKDLLQSLSVCVGG